jgi:hypothetical protein
MFCMVMIVGWLSSHGVSTGSSAARQLRKAERRAATLARSRNTGGSVKRPAAAAELDPPLELPGPSQTTTTTDAAAQDGLGQHSLPPPAAVAAATAAAAGTAIPADAGSQPKASSSKQKGGQAQQGRARAERGHGRSERRLLHELAHAMGLRHWTGAAPVAAGVSSCLASYMHCTALHCTALTAQVVQQCCDHMAYGHRG